jgi:alkanesulfonate monooxygenase SsuD/methylene tetrahydromethanopterin reductase-like flavin-dependent oxidoreductase (luciferase family)
MTTPRPVQPRLPVWIAVGSTPARVVRAGRQWLALHLAILGQPERFARSPPATGAARPTSGNDEHQLPVGVTSHLHVEETSQGARDAFPPTTPATSATTCQAPRADRCPATGSTPGPDRTARSWSAAPEQVIEKFLWEHELLGLDRFPARIGLGGLLFVRTACSSELLATEVLPVIRRETARSAADG